MVLQYCPWKCILQDIKVRYVVLKIVDVYHSIMLGAPFTTWDQLQL